VTPPATERTRRVLTWDEGVETLAAASGVVVLIGATDVGKSTLVLQAANRAVAAGRRAAILDTDVGQGEVGPPGTLGIARLEVPVAELSLLRPRAMAFVGDISPVGHLLAVVQGARRLVRHALEREDEVVFVDTSGFVAGRLAERLKLAKVSILEPALVVLVRRGRELERLAELVAGTTAAPVVEVRTPPEVGYKAPVYRRIQRANRLRRHFERARRHELDASRVSVVEAWVYTGELLPRRRLDALGAALRTEIPHGEETADGIYLCCAGPPDRAAAATLYEEFGRRRVWITPTHAFRGLLLGLVGLEGRLIELAILEAINFERSLFSLLTPARTLDEVTQVHFGRLRVRPDGSEVARLRPGDL
jgi:polynucleotide 5'-hydroxyl-kinase GRC3/NOL9